MKRKFLAVLSGITLLVFGSLMASPATATDSDHNTVVWTMHGDSTPDHPFTETQTFAGFAKDNPSLACGTWYQVDTYRPGHPFGTTVFTLSSPAEDAQWIQTWHFQYGGDCAPPPLVCPEGQVAGAPNDDGVYICQNDNPTPLPKPTPPIVPKAPKPHPVAATPSFTG